MIARNLGPLENRKVQDFLGLGRQFFVDFPEFRKVRGFRGDSEK